MRPFVSPLLLGLVGCGWFGTVEQADSPEKSEPAPTLAPLAREGLPDVVLVTVDTTRADRIGAYGYDKAITPNLDALAGRGRRYDRAYSPLPLTIPAHASLFTGKYPPALGIRSNGAGRLEEAETTLAERMKAAGYRTAGSVAAFVTTRTWGFDQGFDAYFDNIDVGGGNFWHAERPGAAVVDDALAWKKAQPTDRPLFLWVHLYDAHFPYFPPEPFAKQQEGRPYDGEIAYLDHQIGRLFEAFDKDKTVFVVVGDHGESLGDHGELTHGLFTYDATQRVPYLMAGPGVSTEVVAEPVSLVDVTPTLLSVLKLDVPTDVHGRVAPGSPEKPVYLESWQLAQRFGLAPHVTVVSGAEKLIATPRPEVYGLGDPGELTDLAGKIPPERLAELQAALAAFGFAPPGDAPQVDPESAMQLAALGYVEGRLDPSAIATLPDPKDHLKLVRRAQTSERHLLVGDVKKGTEILEELVKEYPKVVELKNRLAMAYGRMNRNEDARRLIDECILLDPDNLLLQVSKGTYLANAGKYDEAAVIFRKAAEALPYAPRLRAMAVAALRDGKHQQEALDLGLLWLEDHPDDSSLAGLVGVMLIGARQPDRAMPWIEVGARGQHPEYDVSFFHAAALLARGDLEGARRSLAREVEFYPGNLKAGFSLANVLGMSKDYEAQVKELERLLQRAPKNAELHYKKTLALFNLKRYDQARAAVDAGLALAPEHPQLVLMDANLLAKEGKREVGAQRFALAQQLKERFDAEAAKAMDEARMRALRGEVPEGVIGEPAE